MDIKTVGERVRLLTAIKALRQECYLAASLAARTPTRVNYSLSCINQLEHKLILFSSYIIT